MNKIYVITAGSYSDYHIVTVFSKKELADKFSNLTDCKVEEYEIDKMEPQIKKGLVPWEVGIQIDGETIYNYRITKNLEYFKPDVVFHKLSFYSEKGGLIVSCYASTAEHAVKIASEKRAEYIASTGWHGPVQEEGKV
jgi:hypothetical protein